MDGPLAIVLAFIAGIAFASCALLLFQSLRGPKDRRAAEATRPAAPPRPWDSHQAAARHSDSYPAPLSSIVMGNNMDECLERVAAKSRAQSVVLADDEGLLLSTSGDARYHEPLGVLTGLATGLFEQGARSLPMGQPSSVEIKDQDGATVVCRFFSYGKQRMAVTSFGSSSQSMTPELERALGGLQAILEHHNNAA